MAIAEEASVSTVRTREGRAFLGAVLATTLVAMAGCDRSVPGALPLLTTVARVRALASGDAERGYPVRLRGTVTYVDAASPFLTLHMGPDGVGVDTTNITTPLAFGRQVEIEGRTGLGSLSVVVLATTVKDMGVGETPAALPISLADLASPLNANRWVEVEGTVRSSVRDNDGRLTLNIVSTGGRFQARFATVDSSLGDAFVDSRIRVQGVANTTFNVNNEAVRLRILVPTLQHLVARDARIADPFSIAVQPIVALRTPAPDTDPGHRVRVQGMVTTHRDGTTVVADDTGRVIVRADSTASLQSGSRVDVLGYPLAQGTALALEDAIVRPIGDAVSSSNASDGSRAPGNRPTPMRIVTTIADVRGMPSVEAGRGHQVRLRAVVTTGDGSSVFVQDATAGIYVPTNEHFESGQAVDVVGETAAGNFAPIITNARLTVAGRAELPTPVRVPITELFSGAYDSQWSEAEGIVQSVDRQGDDASLLIANGSYTFRAFVPGLGNQPLPTGLVDAKVRVVGACRTTFNDKRQLLGISLQLPAWKQLTVLEPAGADAGSLPVHAINTLMQFGPGNAAGHRVRLQGTATLQQSNGSIYLTDATGGVLIRTPQKLSVVPGDRLDVVGFAAKADYLPELRNAVVTKIGEGLPSAAAHVTVDEALSGSYHAQLVRIEAQLLDQAQRGTERVLTLHAGSRTFTASVENPLIADGIPAIRPGSVVRVTGVCLVDPDATIASGNRVRIQGFHLLLRGGNDVVVLNSASWWSAARVLWLAGGLAVMGSRIAQRQAELCVQAEVLAGEVLSESADDFIERLGKWWDDWRG